MGFPFGHSRQLQLHFACTYAVVSRTNIHDPARFAFCGDIISGPARIPFGAGVRDVDLRELRGQSWRFRTRSTGGSRSRRRRGLRSGRCAKALDLTGLRLRA